MELHKQVIVCLTGLYGVTVVWLSSVKCTGDNAQFQLDNISTAVNLDRLSNDREHYQTTPQFGRHFKNIPTLVA